MALNLLALDLATVTGWAAWHDGLTSGTMEFRLERGESPGMRYLRFRAWLEEMAGLVKPQVVAYEQAYLMPTAQTSELFFGFITLVQAVCASGGIEHMAVNAQSLKKWTTGGAKVLGHRATKQDMIDAVGRRWKVVQDHNEADAIAILYYAMEKLSVKETTP